MIIQTILFIEDWRKLIEIKQIRETFMLTKLFISLTFRSLVDTVYALRDQVRELQNQVTSLAKEVELLKNVLP